MAAKYEPDMEVVKELEKELGKGSKAPKDENAPKRPLTAFLQWSIATRPGLVEANPDLKLGEVGKKLGEMWKATDAATKNKYQSRYDEEKAVFDKKMEKYMKTKQWRDFQNAQLAWKIHGTKKPFRQDKNAPKRAMNGYMTFINENRESFRADNQEMALTEVTKALTKQWRDMGEDGQQVYKDKSAKQKIQYKKKFDSYTKTDNYKEYVEEKEAYLAKMRAKRNKLLGIKKKKKVKKPVAVSSESEEEEPSRSRSRGRRERRKSKKAMKNKKSKKSKNRKRKRSSSRSSSRSASREAKRMKRSRSKKSRSKGRKSSKKKAGKRKKSRKSKTKKSKKRAPPSDDSQTEMDESSE